MRYWQQAAGDGDRNYAQICLEWDVILNGPGYAGRWPECEKQLRKDEVTSRKISDIRRFCEDISEGDIIILRLGTNQVSGIGIVIGDYEYLPDLFGDVDGWDIQHVRRVKWLWKNIEEPKTFPTYTLNFGDTTQLLDHEKSKEVLEWIERLNLNFSEAQDLKQLPSSENRKVSLNDVFESLFDDGVSSTSIEALNKEIDELIRIAKWYQTQKSTHPSEAETISYLVVPLLRSLGWTPQKMAIEWNNVDVALFNKLPRENDNLSVVVEVKRKGSSCLTALSQASNYAEGKEKCHRLIVTDGLRYGTYIKDGSSFKLQAYFNITDLKACYPIYACKGVYEALQVMTTEWLPNQ